MKLKTEIFCHNSIGSIINGKTKIGNKCFICSNTIISNNKTIIDKTTISAGSQVLNNISEHSVYIDIPIRKIR